MKITAEYLRENGKRITSPVLAEGEVTGHKHELATMDGVERYELEGRRFLVVNAEGGVSIEHQEHGVGVIPAGVYEERIDREYDYLTEMSRQVAD
jgi:hypothetical protein